MRRSSRSATSTSYRWDGERQRWRLTRARRCIPGEGHCRTCAVARIDDASGGRITHPQARQRWEQLATCSWKCVWFYLLRLRVLSRRRASRSRVYLVWLRRLYDKTMMMGLHTDTYTWVGSKGTLDSDKIIIRATRIIRRAATVLNTTSRASHECGRYEMRRGCCHADH